MTAQRSRCAPSKLTGVVAIDGKALRGAYERRQKQHAAAYGQRLRDRSSNGPGVAQSARPQRGQRSVGSSADAVARRLYRLPAMRCIAIDRLSRPCSSVAAITRWRSSKIRASCSRPSHGTLPAPASAASPSDWSRPLTTATNPGVPPSYATPAWRLQTTFQGSLPWLASPRADASMASAPPFGERVGVRGLRNYRETLTPHPTPLPLGEGADRVRCKNKD